MNEHRKTEARKAIAMLFGPPAAFLVVGLLMSKYDYTFLSTIFYILSWVWILVGKIILKDKIKGNGSVQ